MASKRGLLLPLTRTKALGQYYVFDIESKAGRSQDAGFTRPFLVGWYDGAEYIAFRDSRPPTSDDDYWSPGGCVDSFMRFALSPAHRGKRIYAHNGGRFDFLHLLAWIQAEGYEFTIVPVGSTILLLKVRRPGDGKRTKGWTFVDSMRLIPTGLDDAAAAFGVPGKLARDLSWHESDSRWEKYNEQDCRALHRVIDGMREQVESVMGGEVGLTLPATAMKVYRRRFQKLPLDRAEDAHRLAREAYYGGRTETFRRSGDRLYYYDRNSSYPAAMLEPMPVGRARWLKGDPGELLRSRIGMVECDVRVPEHLDPPVLPVRHGGRLVFATGRLRGTWDSHELVEAIAAGCEVVRWGQSCWFTGEPILRDYMLHLQHYRDRSLPTWNATLDYIAKILRNSFYGKFGQNPEREQIVRDGRHEKVVKDADYIIPQIACHVTALARLALYRQMVVAKQHGGLLYMVDTDSAVTDVPLPESFELGGWKGEYSAYHGLMSGVFLAPKMYYLYLPDGKPISVKAKGLERDYKTVDALEALRRGERIVQQRLEKVGSLARRGFESCPRLLSVPRTWKQDDGSKRHFLSDGSSTPLHLAMW